MTDPVISAHVVKMKFPVFVDTPDTAIEMAIQEAELEVDSTWGALQTLGLLYMTAHILTVEAAHSQSGTGREIASESFAGVVSVTYAPGPSASEMSIGDLKSTHYGLRLLGVMRDLFPAVAVV